MGDCLFCKIVAGEIPSNKVYEDEFAYAFRDIEPQAPDHILIVPKEHTQNVLECAENPQLLAKLFAVACAIARQEGLDASGFRLVTNCGADAQQSVQHFHIHLLGGKALSGRMA